MKITKSPMVHPRQVSSVTSKKKMFINYPSGLPCIQQLKRPIRMVDFGINVRFDLEA